MMKRLVALCACLVLTACGSTAQLSSGGGTGQGLSPDGVTTSVESSLAGQGGAAAPSTSGSLAPGAVAAGALPTSSVPAGAGPAVRTTPVDPGQASAAVATKKPVEVGVVIYPDIKEFGALFGAEGSPGDQKAEAEAAIAWINTHGGLNGHKVVPVYFEVELTSTQTYSETYQQICSSFTEDHKVVAAVVIGNAEAGLPSCLAKRGVLFLGHGHYLRDDTDYRSLTNVVTPNDAGSVRVARAMVAQMLAKGALKRGDELGLMIMNYAAPQRAGALMTSLLKEQGISVASYTVPYPQSTQDISNSAAVVQSAVLSMAARGIKTAAFLCPGCVTFFLTYAESQAYYPRYVVSSYDTVGGVKGQGHGRSLTSALALGWDPMRDVGAYTHPQELAGNKTHALCKTIEKAHAVDDTSTFGSQAFCGGLLDLYAAAQANPVEPLTGGSLMGGFDRLGSSHAGTANFSTLLSSARHDGVASYRTMGYDAACDCFRYESRTLHPLT